MFNGRLYEKLCNKNNDEFWKAWRKRFCSRKLRSASVINGCTGVDNIRREFTEYYQSIFSANTSNADDKYIKMHLIKSASCGLLPLIDIHVLQDCVPPPPSVWPHLFCGAGHAKRRGEQLKWSLAFRLYIGSFHVHSYTRTSSHSPVGPIVFF